MTKNVILRPKNVIFERFWHLSKFHFPACNTLVIIDKFIRPFPTGRYGMLRVT